MAENVQWIRPEFAWLAIRKKTTEYLTDTNDKIMISDENTSTQALVANYKE